jgi:diacylglycerol kinase (ATP)
VRVAAILHPYAKDKLLEPFRAPGMNLFRGNELEANDLPQVVIVFGGDGSVHRVIQALAGSETPLLVVPTGSGNDFAAAIGIHSYGEAVSVWRKFVEGQAHIREIDLGVIKPLQAHSSSAGGQEPEWVDGRLTFAREDGTFEKAAQPLAPAIARAELHHLYDSIPTEEYFCCIAGAGLDAEANKRANRMPAWLRRRGGYVVSALRALAAHQSIKVTVADGGHRQTNSAEARFISENALLVAFANAPAYGNGMRMAPRALLDDGLLDVCYVGHLSKWKVLRLFHTIFSGTHLRFPEVKYFSTDSVRLFTESPLEIYGDGEYICRTPVEISVRPRSLRVLVP